MAPAPIRSIKRSLISALRWVPYAVADLAGLDIGWMTRKRKAPDRHPNERVPTYIDKLCEQGHFGRKTGEGYYLYEAGSRASVPNPKIPDLIAAEQAALKITPREFTDEADCQTLYVCDGERSPPRLWRKASQDARPTWIWCCCLATASRAIAVAR